MRCMMTIVLAAVIGGSISSADDTKAFMKTKAPQFVVVSQVDSEKGEIYLILTVNQPVPKTVVEVVEENGKKVQKQKVVVDTVREDHMRPYRIADLRIITTDGRKIDGAEELKALVNKTVLLAADSDGVDPIFLALLSKNAVVITPLAKNKPKGK